MSSDPCERPPGEFAHRAFFCHADGLLYLPEILYRRILNQAFGPGGWGMVPRGEMTVTKGMVSREWGLVAGGRQVCFPPRSEAPLCHLSRQLTPGSASSGLSLLLVESRRTLTRRDCPPPPRGARATLSCAAARTLALLASFGESCFSESSIRCSICFLPWCSRELMACGHVRDPAFIRKFKTEHCVEAWTEHGSTKKKQRRWRKKGNKFEYPLVEAKA